MLLTCDTKVKLLLWAHKRDQNVDPDFFFFLNKMKKQTI